MEHPSFIKMMNNIRSNLDPNLNDEKQSELGTEIGKHINIFIEETTKEWTGLIHAKISEDKDSLDQFLTASNFNAGITRDAILQERSDRNDDRNNLSTIIHKLGNHIIRLRSDIEMENKDKKNPNYHHPNTTRTTTSGTQISIRWGNERPRKDIQGSPRYIGRHPTL